LFYFLFIYVQLTCQPLLYAILAESRPKVAILAEKSLFLVTLSND